MSGVLTHRKSSISETSNRERKLKISELQNEIQSLLLKRTDLETENKLLKRTQERQSVALKRYEGREGQLPNIIRSHEEEVRVLKELLKRANEKQKLSEKKENSQVQELNKLREQFQKFQKIIRVQNLEERYELNSKVELLQNQLEDREKKIIELERNLKLVNKNYKHQLAIEFSRHKETKRKLLDSQEELDKLIATLKVKDRKLNVANIYTGSSTSKSVALSPDVSKQGSNSDLQYEEDEEDESQTAEFESDDDVSEDLQIKSSKFLPNIDKPDQSTSQIVLDVNDLQNQPNSLDNNANIQTHEKFKNSNLNAFARDAGLDNTITPLAEGELTAKIMSNPMENQSQKVQVWLTSQSKPGQQFSIVTNNRKKETDSPKSKKANLMKQLFGSFDNKSSTDTVNVDGLSSKSVFATTSHLSPILSRSPSLLPRRPREKSNIISEHKSPIVEAFEDDINTLVL